MNTRALGYSRDKSILSLISEHGCLNAEQIEALLFPHMKSGRRKAQMRLRSLVVAGRLRRWRYSLEEPYAYYINREKVKLDRLEHLVCLNWVFVWLKVCRKNWHRLHSFQYEPDYRIMRPDALACLRNVATGKQQWYFIEMDRYLSQNPFDKVQKYNTLYEQPHLYTAAPWTETGHFPHIIIATDHPNRLAAIERHVATENRHGLSFQIHHVNDLRREVLSCVRQLPNG